MVQNQSDARLLLKGDQAEPASTGSAASWYDSTWLFVPGRPRSGGVCGEHGLVALRVGSMRSFVVLEVPWV